MLSTFNELRGNSLKLSKEEFLKSNEIRLIMKNGDIDADSLTALFIASGADATSEMLAFDNFVYVLTNLLDHQSLMLSEDGFEDSNF